MANSKAAKFPPVLYITEDKNNDNLREGSDNVAEIFDERACGDNDVIVAEYKFVVVKRIVRRIVVEDNK